MLEEEIKFLGQDFIDKEKKIKREKKMYAEVIILSNRNKNLDKSFFMPCLRFMKKS